MKKKKCVSKKQRKEEVTVNRRDCLNMSAMLDNLLEFSKLLNETMRIVHETLSDIESEFGGLFTEEGIEMMTQVMTDAEIIKVLDTMYSLIDNAGKMSDYSSLITDDISRVLHVEEDMESE